MLDKQLAPLVLELNARPGLNVKLANDRGLLLNLRHVEKLKILLVSVQDRVEYAQTHLAAAGDWLGRP